MSRVIKRVWYDCPTCIQRYADDEVFYECRSAVGQYGTIVLASVYCKCGFKLANDEMVDNSGNIPGDKNE